MNFNVFKQNCDKSVKSQSFWQLISHFGHCAYSNGILREIATIKKWCKYRQVFSPLIKHYQCSVRHILLLCFHMQRKWLVYKIWHLVASAKYIDSCREEEKQRSKLPSMQESLFEGHLSFSASAGLLVLSTELRFLPEYKGRKRLQIGRVWVIRRRMW